LLLLGILALAPILSAAEDGEILDASIVLTVTPDLKVKEEVSITKRLISYQSLDTDGDPRTPYCGAQQTLAITRARVTTPSGKVIDSTPNALNLSTPEALVEHPPLTGWQEMVVTFLGLEPGSKTELSYVREDKAAFRTTFEKKQVLAWHFPIRKGTVVVRLPKNMPLTYQMMNLGGEASTKTAGEFTEYTFAFKDIPAFNDHDLNGGGEFLPAIYLTTTPSWDAAGKNLAALAEKFGAPDEAIKKKAADLTKDAMTDLDKTIAIHKFIKERFKEVEWPLQDSLLLINSADKTFASGQGTNLELALLMRAMMKTVVFSTGEWSELVLSGPLPAPEKAPGLMAFNRAMVLADAIYWEAEEVVGSDPSGRYIIRESARSGSIPWKKGAALIGEIELKKDGLSGSASLDLTGTLNTYWKNLEEKGALEDAAKAFLPFPGVKVEELAAKILGKELTRLEIKFTGKIKEGERIVRLLPESKAFLPEVDPRITSARLPVRLPDAHISIRWTVTGLSGPTAPAFKAEGKWGAITVQRTPDGSSLKVEAKVEVKDGPLPPADYPALQAALAAWQNPIVAGFLWPEH